MTAFRRNQSASRSLLRRLFDAALLLLTLLTAAATIVSAYGGTVNPEVSPLPGLAAMAFPAVLFAALAMLAVNLLFARRYALITGLSLLVCVGPILTYCPLNFFRPSMKTIVREYPDRFKLMTFNVFGFIDYTDPEHSSYTHGEGNRTLEYILAEDPDIVTLQEPGRVLYLDSGLSSDDQKKQVREKYPYRHIHRGVTAILSKFPLEQVDVDADTIRGLGIQRYDVDIRGQKIHLFNVHLQSIYLLEEDKQIYVDITEGEHSDSIVTDLRHNLLSKVAAAMKKRAAQARAVRQELDRVDGDILLCGDFNDIPGSYAARQIQGADMTDAFRQSGLGPGVTYHDDRLYFRIDQIFYRGRLEALRTWNGDCPYSDHYPLISIFNISK